MLERELASSLIAPSKRAEKGVSNVVTAFSSGCLRFIYIYIYIYTYITGSIGMTLYCSVNTETTGGPYHKQDFLQEIVLVVPSGLGTETSIWRV